VFNFSHEELSKVILDRFKNKVEIRMITDDEQLKGEGSQVSDLSKAGIPIRTDCSEAYHMHNKFVVVDDAYVITGSFNWTYTAVKHN